MVFEIANRFFTRLIDVHPDTEVTFEVLENWINLGVGKKTVETRKQFVQEAIFRFMANDHLDQNGTAKMPNLPVDQIKPTDPAEPDFPEFLQIKISLKGGKIIEVVGMIAEYMAEKNLPINQYRAVGFIKNGHNGQQYAILQRDS